MLRLRRRRPRPPRRRPPPAGGGPAASAPTAAGPAPTPGRPAAPGSTHAADGLGPQIHSWIQYTDPFPPVKGESWIRRRRQVTMVNVPVERWTPERRRELTRTALVDAAAEVFARRGFHDASLDEIAETAGFTRGAIYKNFGIKEELFYAVGERQNELTL